MKTSYGPGAMWTRNSWILTRFVCIRDGRDSKIRSPSFCFFIRLFTYLLMCITIHKILLFLFLFIISILCHRSLVTGQIWPPNVYSRYSFKINRLFTSYSLFPSSLQGPTPLSYTLPHFILSDSLRVHVFCRSQTTCSDSSFSSRSTPSPPSVSGPVRL